MSDTVAMKLTGHKTRSVFNTVGKTDADALRVLLAKSVEKEGLVGGPDEGELEPNCVVVGSNRWAPTGFMTSVRDHRSSARAP